MRGGDRAPLGSYEARAINLIRRSVGIRKSVEGFAFPPRVILAQFWHAAARRRPTTFLRLRATLSFHSMRLTSLPSPRRLR
jgi:hypothetical protein